jgi:hypothetical protein
MPKKNFFCGRNCDNHTTKTWVNLVLVNYTHSKTYWHPSSTGKVSDEDKANTDDMRCTSIDFLPERYLRKGIVYIISSIKYYLFYPDIFDTRLTQYSDVPTFTYVYRKFDYTSPVYRLSSESSMYNFSFINTGRELNNDNRLSWVKASPLIAYFWAYPDSVKVFYLTPLNYFSSSKDGYGLDIFGCVGMESHEHIKILPFYFYKQEDSVLPTPGATPLLCFYVNNINVHDKRFLIFKAR